MSPDSIRRSLVRRGSGVAATVVNGTNRLIRSRTATVARADANRAFLQALAGSGEPLAASTRRARKQFREHLQRSGAGVGSFGLRIGRTAWTAPTGTFGKALNLVETAVDAGDLHYAGALVERLLDERPRSPRAHELRAAIKAASGDWAAAKKDWRLALQRTTAEPEELRRAVATRVREEKVRARLRAAVVDWSGEHTVADLDERCRQTAAQLLSLTDSPRHGAQLEAALEALLARTVTVDDTSTVARLFDGYAATRGRTPPPEPTWLDPAVDEASALADDGDYAAATDVLDKVATAPGALQTNRFLLLWARMLSATSRYEAARAVLGLVTTPQDEMARAQFQQARIAWITHRYEEGAAAARRSLDADPERHAASRMLELIESSSRRRDSADAAAVADGIAHIAFYPGPAGNFGDVALPVAVRAAVETATAPTTWRPYHAHQVVDDITVRQLNAHRAVVVGGGGLFLPDTSPNGNSGWQWNVDNDHLGRITAPLALFAVGYNLFPGQSFKGALFQDSIQKLAGRARFLGLRNHGSIDRVRSYLPESLQDKVRYVPCPTTILSRVRPSTEPPATGTGRVLLNAAFDRGARRYGERYREFLQEMVRLVDGVRAAGAEIVCAAHLPSDERLADDLRTSFDREVPVERLYDGSLDESLAVYRDASLVIGMRGHATMIPFGLGTPVLSIVSHPKMRYFLDDIDRPAWAFDVDAPDLGEQLLESTLDVLAREGTVRREVHGLQEQLVEPVFSAARSLVG